MLVLALGVVGCSESVGPGGNGGVGGEAGAGGQGGSTAESPWRRADPAEAEAACLAWCEAGCDDSENCYESCRSGLARTCGALELAVYQCALDHECSVYHSSCTGVRGSALRCPDELAAFCTACGPDTLCGSDAETCGCLITAGDCNTSWFEARCRIAVDSGECASLESCSIDRGHDLLLPCVGDTQCIEWREGDELCESREIEPIEPCCSAPAPPEQPDACDGSDSVVNPTSCTGDGVVRTYLLTELAVHPDCNAGFDLDGCHGSSCWRGGLTGAEGVDGVDNQVAALGSVIEGIGGNLQPLNQGFANMICGKADWNSSVEGCETDIPKLELRFSVNADASESCAKVIVSTGSAELGSFAMNLSDDGCLSGSLPDIPFEYGGTRLELSNVTLRTTIGAAGFSNGLMGATGDMDVAIVFWEAITPGAGTPINAQIFDINQDLSGDNERLCSAISGTYKVGGVAE